MTDHVRNTTDDLIRLPVLSTRDSITFAGVSNAIHHDSSVTIQNLATTAGSVIQTDEMSFFH
jgi:CO/xanthine dehydrogenase FAD-binding subunit